MHATATGAPPDAPARAPPLARSAKGFGRGGEAAGSGSGGGGGGELGEGAGIGNSESLTEEDRKWRLEAGAVGEWQARARGGPGVGLCGRRTPGRRQPAGRRANPPPRAPRRAPQRWVEDQKEFAGMEAVKRNVWMQVQLDGTVRASGLGTPPWQKLAADLPPLDSLRTKVTDGIGPSV